MSTQLSKSQPQTSERLERIAVELRKHVTAAESAHRTAMNHALQVGELLAEARRLVPRGTWGRWLAHNFAGSPTIAATYIRLAEHRVELADARTITAAVAQIAPSAQAVAADERNHEADPMAGYRLTSSSVARALVHAGDWSPTDKVPSGYLPVADLRARCERLLSLINDWETSLGHAPAPDLMGRTSPKRRARAAKPEGVAAT
jgi:hypothetical protein